MPLPQPDPSNPALPAPLFADVDAVRGDHLRANNQLIWENLQYLFDFTGRTTDTLTEGATNLYYTDVRAKAAALAAALTGYAAGSDAALAATDTILQAFAKTQGQITADKAAIAALQALTPTVLWVRDEKSSGTAAAALSASTWNKRELGTTSVNDISGASVTSSVITLPAGTYEVAAFAMLANLTSDSVGHQIRLYNTSDSALIVKGSSSWVSTGNTSSTPSIIQNSRFTLAATKNIELQHWTGGNNPGGKAVSSGSVEVYAEVFIKKVA